MKNKLFQIISNTFKHIRIFTIFFLLTNCSLLIKLDKQHIDYSVIHSSKNIPKICNDKKNQNTQIVGDGKLIAKTFLKFTNQLEKKIILKPIEKFALFTLLQMLLRPDQSSPFARFQVLIGNKNKFKYWDVSSNTNKDWSSPIFRGIELLLNHYNSKYSLIKLASIIDLEFKPLIKVTPLLSQFLSTNQNIIKKSSFQKKYYFKSDQIIHEGESLKNISLRKIVKLYLLNKNKHSKHYTLSNHLFSFKSTDFSSHQKNYIGKVQCNYDLFLYKKSIYPIGKHILKNNLFGIKIKNLFFLASSGQNLDTPIPVKGTPFFKSKTPSRPIPFCYYKNSFLNFNLLLVSAKGRDPGQYLYNIFNLDLSKLDDLKDLESLLNFPRYLILLNPPRILFESGKSDQFQLDEFLKLNFNIYNKNTLGNIWAYASFNQSKTLRKGFVTDARQHASIACQ